MELLKKLKSEGGEIDMVIVSYDEKPGIQAIGNKHPDLMPVEGKHPTYLVIMNIFAMGLFHCWLELIYLLE